MNQRDVVAQPVGPAESPTHAAGMLSPRARAWLWAACAAALVLSYLVVWSVYSMDHLPDFARYRQLAPGATASSSDADFTLVGLVQSRELSVTEGRAPAGAAGAVWVVATLQVVPRTAAAAPVCNLELLGAGRRAWQEAMVSALRPERYADQIYGVALLDGAGGQPRQVLTAG